MDKPKSKYSNAGHRKRIRQKLLQHGEDIFFDYELIELLLTYSIPYRDVKPIAKDLVSKFDDLRGVIDARPKDLSKVTGIGENSIALFQLLKSVNSRYLQEKCMAEENLSSPSKLAKFANAKIGGNIKEAMLLMFLDAKGALIDFKTLEYGDIRSIKVSVQYILTECYNNNSPYLAVAHNHPSGDCKPSKSDIDFTIKLKSALTLNEMVLVDHIIVSPYTSFSMKTHGFF